MDNNKNSFFKKFLDAFTLAEVLIATAIVGVIAGLVLPTTIQRAQERSFDQAYTRNIQTIADAVNALPVVENKDFFKTEMYSDSTPSDYSNSSGKFIKKYLKVSRYCGNDTGLCFASKYYKFNENKKEVYTPPLKGACAKLKNGASICLEPQIGATGAKGFIDLNGTKGPNILDRDLKVFSLEAKTKANALDKTQTEVAVTTAPNIGGSDPCDEPDSLACCLTKTAALPAACCTNYPEQFASNPACAPTPVTDPCESEPKGLACCQKTGVNDTNKGWCCKFSELKNNAKCVMMVPVKLTCQVNYKAPAGTWQAHFFNTIDEVRYSVYILEFPTDVMLKSNMYEFEVYMDWTETNSSPSFSYPYKGKWSFGFHDGQAQLGHNAIGMGVIQNSNGKYIAGRDYIVKDNQMTSKIDRCGLSMSGGQSQYINGPGTVTIQVPAVPNP